MEQITVFVDRDLDDIPTPKSSLFHLGDLRLSDDFYFETVIKRMVSGRNHGKLLIVDADGMREGVRSKVAQAVVDVVAARKATPRVRWESDLRAFNSVQCPDIVAPSKRIVYSEERQIVDALKKIKCGELQNCDTVYVHISLWMRPREQFKRLMMAHFARFDDVCFYALRSSDLDDRARQIVQWLFRE